MLNSFQLEEALQERAFVSLSSRKRTKAHGYKRSDLAHPVYVKIGGSKSRLKAVDSNPLVLHPYVAAALRSLPSLPAGIRISENPYKNAGLLLFKNGDGKTPFGFGVAIESTAALDALLALIIDATVPGKSVSNAAEKTAPEIALEVVNALTAEDYRHAFLAISPHITEAQRLMLLGHAAAPGQTLSMAQIAAFGGYGNFATANLQYGKLGGLFAKQLGIHGLSQEVLVLALAYGAENSRALGHWQWVLRPQLTEALVSLGLIVSAAQTWEQQAAATEIANDPSCSGIEETTRQALIDARIGQGAYRRGVMALWSGRCAVTNCSIAQVLVASHIKPWKISDNMERLDAHNGLLLVASVDKLFDRGLISFDDEGCLLTNDLSAAELAQIGLRPNSRLRLLLPQHRAYLAHHRQIFGFNRH